MDESVIKHLEQQQQIGALKLSEAIRIGAKLRHQCTRGYYFENGGSCALGAAFEALYGRTNELAVSLRLREHYKIDRDSTVFGRIIDKNDAGITREHIADWLEAQGY